MPSQANQQILRKVIKDWKSYFESCKEYAENPGKFTGHPSQPGYIRETSSTAIYTNQITKPHVSKDKLYLTFPGCSLDLCIGKETDGYVKAEVKPCSGGYKVCVTNI